MCVAPDAVENLRSDGAASPDVSVRIDTMPAHPACNDLRQRTTQGGVVVDLNIVTGDTSSAFSQHRRPHDPHPAKSVIPCCSCACFGRSTSKSQASGGKAHLYSHQPREIPTTATHHDTTCETPSSVDTRMCIWGAHHWPRDTATADSHDHVCTMRGAAGGKNSKHRSRLDQETAPTGG